MIGTDDVEKLTRIPKWPVVQDICRLLFDTSPGHVPVSLPGA